MDKRFQFCVSCLMPSTRPRISFDADGKCNGCKTWGHRTTTDWRARRDELSRIASEAASEASARESQYDCVLAWSGGKDSSAIALRLKEEFGLRTLLVTFNQLIPTDEGRRNRQALLEHGFDSLLIEPSIAVSRKLSRHFFLERGDPKLHWNAGVHAAPVRVAVNLNVPLVFFAENGEAEYGGRLLSAEHLRSRDYAEMTANAVGGDPLDWSIPDLHPADLAPYLYPTTVSPNTPRPEVLYFAYFMPWDGKANLEYVKSHVDFVESHRGRNYGAFSGYNGVDDVMEDFYYYMQYVKFGFGRAWKDASRMIQRGHLTRAEARDLIKETDGEFPADSLAPVADYLELPVGALLEGIDRFRADSLWRLDDTGKWNCRFNIDDAVKAVE